MIEFFITRNGMVLIGETLFGSFDNETKAADAAIRHAQDQGMAYRIFYPL